jgi:hypothetical protein
MRAFLLRIKNILVDPRSEWPLIAIEPGNPWRLMLYVAVLAAIPVIAGYIGATYVGVQVSAGRFHDTPLVALFKSSVSYVFSFVIVGLTALVIDLLAPLFKAHGNFRNALKLAVYSYTPVWLIGIVLVVPGLRFLTILGLYALRLLWTGLPPLMGAPRAKVLGYAVAVCLAGFFIVFVMAVIQSAITTLPFRR